MSVPGDELVLFLTSDVSGLNRGRAVPAAELERRRAVDEEAERPAPKRLL